MKQRDLLTQLATPLNHPFRVVGVPGSNGSRLPVTDELLRRKGGISTRAYDLYLSLLNDARVNTSFNKLVSEITSRDWEVEPATGSEVDKQIARDVSNIIEQIGQPPKTDSAHALFYQESGINYVTKAAAVALITGIQPLEVIWAKPNRKSKPIIETIKARDISRFNLFVDKGGEVFPRMLTRTNQIEGVTIPPRKVIFARVWNVAIENEYGSGLGRQLYDLVNWKRQLITFWLSYTDRLSQPIAVGKFDSLARKEDITEFRAAVDNIGQEMGLTMPDKFSLDFVSASSSSAGMFQELLDYIDTQITTLILGEATTGEANTGSNNKDEISNSIRLMRAHDLSKSIDAILNHTLIRWIVDVRHGVNYKAPTISRKFEETDDPSVFADLLIKLQQAGITVDPDYVQDKLDLPLVANGVDRATKFADLLLRLKQAEVDITDEEVRNGLGLALVPPRVAIESPTVMPEINI